MLEQTCPHPRGVVALAAAQNNLCCFCHKRMSLFQLSECNEDYPGRATKEHVKPKSKGGKRLKASCLACNSTRGHLDYVKFESTLQRLHQKYEHIRNAWHTLSTKERSHMRQLIHILILIKRYEKSGMVREKILVRIAQLGQRKAALKAIARFNLEGIYQEW